MDPHVATGAPVAGVPVVDLTATVNGLLEHAEDCRNRRMAALGLAESLARQADYLEDLARILGGTR